MRLSDYEWSRNPRGLHVQRILITPLNYDRWTRPDFGWVKLIAAGDEYINDSEDFIRLGVTPVLRPYRARWGARPLDAEMRDQILAYRRAGVRWYEFYNEPNLGIEWPEGIDPDWRDTQNIIAPLCENWLTWAEFVVSIGGYPGFISLAESTDLKYAAVFWMDAMLNYLAVNRRDRFRNVLASGAYCATHPYIFNHWYQEVPGGGPRSARLASEVNASEGGWHFEYPYDPICQANDPGRTVYGGTPRTPNGDPVGLLAMGRMFNERCAALFGSQAVPVLGTEGGIWPFRPGSWQQDTRYPAYDERSQAEGTVAMFEWIARVAPPWMFGVCLWKEDDYYPPEGGSVLAVGRLESAGTIARSIPAQEVMADGFVALPLDASGNAIVGPGPIQGRPQYHMLILAPGLNTALFFETAQAYWHTFRPIITTNLDLIRLLPFDTSLAVTVIAPPETVSMVDQLIADEYPNVWYDLIVADSADGVRNVLNSRVLANRRFG